jgi:nucleotide-binding universal stress UspA family protein
MKVKPARKPGKVMVELGPRDQTWLGSPGSPLFRIKQILVPVDFSECSRKALRYAVPMAKQFEAGLSLVYVVQLAYAFGEFGPTDYPAMEVDMKAEAERQLSELAAEEIGTVVPYTSRVRVGRPATEIVEAARELESDLIIIATHGHTGLKHVLLGSVAENVVRQAPCPVLTVRQEEREFVKS